MLTDTCVRIEWAADGCFVDEPSVFATARAAMRPLGVFTSDGSAPIRATTDRFVLEYRTTPPGTAISHPQSEFDARAGDSAHRDDAASSRPGPHNLNVRLLDRSGPEKVDRVWRPGDSQSRNLGGTLSTLDGLRDARPLDPGLLSRDGWFLIDDSDGHLLDEQGWAVCRSWRGYDAGPQANRRIDWYLFAYADDFAAAMQSLSQVSGPVPLPRRSTLGAWYSRYWPHTSEEFRAIASEFDQRGFPLDVMVLDMDWHSASADGRWTGWSWNRSLLPDAERLLAWMHDRGLHVCLNLHPSEGVGSWETRYAPFMRAMGLDPATGENVEFDAGNRRYMESLFDQVLRPLETPDLESIEATANKSVIAAETRPEVARAAGTRGGVDLWWLDWQQEPEVRSIPGLTNLGWLNHLFFQHSRGNGRRGSGFSRWAGWGDHRHPIHFSGDAHTGWPMLAFQVPFSVSAGNAGCFFWSHDIGGHFGPRNEEATTRWVQFGALSAALRLHSARTEALDRRPWSFAEANERAMRSAFRLRSALMPTIYTAARDAAQHNRPLLRPVWMDHAHNDHAYRSPDQYLIGPDVLVAPIVTPGLGSDRVAHRAVWFPPSESGWSNLATCERFGGDRHAWISASLSQIPVFVRAGAPLFMQPPPARMSGGSGLASQPPSLESAHATAQTLVLRIFCPDVACVFERELYEDDGESDAYTNGAFSVTRVRAEWTVVGHSQMSLRLLLRGAGGSYFNAPAGRAWQIEFAGVSADSGAESGRIETPRDNARSVEGEPGEATVWVRGITGSTAQLLSPITLGPTELPVRAVLAIAVQDRKQPIELQLLVRRDRPEAESVLTPEVIHGEPPIDQESFHASHHAIALGIGPALRTVGPCAQPGVAPPAGIVIDSHGRLDPQQPATVEVVGRIGTSERVTDRHTLQITARPNSPEPTFPMPESPPDEPPIGRISRRLLRLIASVNGEPTVIVREVARRERPLRAWRLQGPFDWDWRWSIGSHSLPPESSPLPPSDDAGCAGQSSERWGLDVVQTLPDRRGAAWAWCRVLSLHAQPVRIRFETSDKLLVRINGTPVFILDDHSGPDATAMACNAHLLCGENLVEVKLTHGWNDWGVSVYLEAEHPIDEVPLGQSVAAPAANVPTPIDRAESHHGA